MVFRSVRWCMAAFWVVACSFPDYVFEAEVPPGVVARCDDGLRNGEEKNVDCGGPECNACLLCENRMRDPDEDGVDCGGPCVACPSCDDGLNNGSESDVDCGGTCSDRCETDQRCRENADCASLQCSSVCEPSSCDDRVRNGGETDEDCGGSCDPCPNGRACEVGDDCESERCRDDVCVSAGCTDGIANGEETDEDCGGPECAPCAVGQGCDSASDCASEICDPDGLCVGPSCEDAVLNQGESDLDCGGDNCPPCPKGARCEAAEDCESELCQNGTCVPPGPTGEPLSSDGWVISTSAADTDQNPEFAIDDLNATSWTSGAQQVPGMYVEVDLQEPRIFFKVLLMTTNEQQFPQRLDISVSSDGSYGEPAFRGVYGGTWLWLDFPSAQVARYLRFELIESKSQPWSIHEIRVWE